MLLSKSYLSLRNKKIPVKKIQEPAPVNVHQKEMGKKATKTGSKKNTAKQLAKDIISVNQVEIKRMSDELRDLKLLNDQLKVFNNYLVEKEEKLERQKEEARRKIAALEEKLRDNEKYKEAVQLEFNIDRQNKLESLATWNVMGNEIDIEGWAWTICHRTKVFFGHLIRIDIEQRFIEPLTWPPVQLPDPFPNSQSYIECN